MQLSDQGLNQSLSHEFFDSKGISVTMKRLDLIDPEITGNKFFKLKYNIQEAISAGHQTVLTFGGTYSNHIAATAFAAKKEGLQSIGIIRGEKPNPLNPTLSAAQANGMELHFISREDYRKKTEPSFLSRLKDKIGDFYLIPEGGTNALAIKGTEEILTSNSNIHTHIMTSIGTGGTFAGLAKSLLPHQTLLGISSLKGNFIHQEIKQLLNTHQISPKGKTEIFDEFHFGGYAKYKDELIQFIWDFYENFRIPLDPVYTGKMAYAAWDLIKKDYFVKGSSILLIHSGGLQGNAGFIERTGIKLPLPL